MNDLIICKVEKSLYAFSLNHVQRIIEFVPLRNVAQSSEFIDGILSYGDDVIEIVNLRRVFGFNSKRSEIEESMQKILIYKKGTVVVGLLVDSIENIISVNRSQFMNITDHEDSAIADIKHVIEYQNELVCVVNNLEVLELVEG